MIILIIFNGLAFIFYGLSILMSKKMQAEFERFKLTKYIALVGTLEILGGLGLLIGFFSNIILSISSLGLSTLMFMGVLTRIKIKDKALLLLPAFLFSLLNAYIFYFSLYRTS